MRQLRKEPLALLLAGLLVGHLLFLAVGPLFAAGTEPPGMPGTLRESVRAPSTYINVRVLAANTAETVTAPTFATYPSAKAIGVFAATCSNWFYNVTTTATVPAADVTDGGASGRAPTSLKMAQGGTVSIIADATCIVTTEWYVEREP